MADVLNRATLQLRTSVNTPDFPVTLYVINPDLTPVAGVPQKYWTLTGDALSEMDAAGKAVVDAVDLAAHNAQLEQLFRDRLRAPGPPLAGAFNEVLTVGLDVIVTIDTVVVNDVTPVDADPALTKTVKVTYIHNKTSDAFSIKVYEKVPSGDYGDLAADEEFAAVFGEWAVGPAGTVLTPV